VSVLLKVKWDYWRYTGAHLAGVGIMIGGQVHEHRVVNHSPNIGVDQSLDLPALIKEEVDARRSRTNGEKDDLLHLDALIGSPILVENDADAHARYRAWFAHQRATPMNSVLIFIKLDGLGGSITYEGRAGALLPFEIGHTVANTSGGPLLTCRCGNNGCLEAVVTPHGMAKQLELEKQAGPSTRAMTNLFFKKVAAGESEALRVFDQGATALGYALANIMSLNSPEAIYISAPEGLHDDRFKREVERCARGHAFPGVRNKSAIIFEPTTSHDDDATAAVAQVIEHTVEKFEHEQFTGRIAEN
jgi:predicted NBD/HSP70 family sugar kinase